MKSHVANVGVAAIVIGVVTFCLVVNNTLAYPNGAGSCTGGEAAVGGEHLQGQTTTGTLSSAGYTVSLDGKTLSPNVAASFTVGQDHTLTIQGSQFNGVLFRLGSTGGVDTTSSLAVRSGDSTLRLASDTCIPLGAGGVTHTSSVTKSSSTAILRLNSVATSLPLDITLVGNRATTFYYSGFVLNAVAATSATTPTASPVSPTKAPVAPINPPTPVAPVAPVSVSAPVSSPSVPTSPVSNKAPTSLFRPAFRANHTHNGSPGAFSSDFQHGGRGGGHGGGGGGNGHGH